MGHRYLQGYVFSRPLEAARLADGAWRPTSSCPRRSPPGPAVDSPALPAARDRARPDPPGVRWTSLGLLGLALAVPFSAPDGTGMQWDELVLAGVAASAVWSSSG